MTAGSGRRCSGSTAAATCSATRSTTTVAAPRSRSASARWCSRWTTASRPSTPSPYPSTTASRRGRSSIATPRRCASTPRARPSRAWSAGGGLAAALVLRAHDRALPAPALQLLVYPMLDDRTALRDHDDRDFRLWDDVSNRFGWRAYLGRAPGHDDVPDHAAPARRRDLAGLAPAWIGVGTADLFHDEDLAYAARLREAGVDVSLEVVPGAFHAFDVVAPRAAVSRAFFEAQISALAQAFARRG
ncbi:MAG: alpha/beta hydrolase fold domain-containing protein [Polyangiales bacterium]